MSYIQNTFEVSNSYKLVVAGTVSALAIGYYVFCIAGDLIILRNLEHARKIEHIIVFEIFAWAGLYMVQSFSQQVSVSATRISVTDIFSHVERPLDGVRGYLQGSSGVGFAVNDHYYLVDNDFKCILSVAAAPEKFEDHEDLISWIETFDLINRSSPLPFLKIRLRTFTLVSMLFWALLLLQIPLLEMAL